jgi:Uma2 family endonuclease
MATRTTTGTDHPGTEHPVAALPVHRIDVDTYNRIVEAGALDDQRVELLEGLIIDMSPQSIPHSLVVERLTHHFRGAPARLRVQLPFEIPPDSEPEPDLALVEEEPSREHQPRRAVLIAEVAVSSHAIDRTFKARHYAHAGVPTYWLIDVPARAVEVRTKPASDRYGECRIYRDGETVPSPVAGVGDLDVSALLED